MGAGCATPEQLWVQICLHQSEECLCLWQEWDRKAEDARREYEKAMKEYEGGRGDSSKR